jgi:hypothetical protein
MKEKIKKEFVADHLDALVHALGLIGLNIEMKMELDLEDIFYEFCEILLSVNTDMIFEKKLIDLKLKIKIDFLKEKCRKKYFSQYETDLIFIDDIKNLARDIIKQLYEIQ